MHASRPIFNLSCSVFPEMSCDVIVIQFSAHFNNVIFDMAEGQPIGENENQQINDGNRGIENDHAGEPAQAEVGNRLWVIVKEIQMVVFGFITSLLPGFHNID